VSTTRRSGLTAGDPAAAPAKLTAGEPAAAPEGLTAGDPAALRFGFVVTFAYPDGYSFPCQHPPRAGMADTFAVS
jgi:hypothetical protein